MKALAAILILTLTLSLTAAAEIEKTSLVCQTGICLYWWPRLPQLKGWHQDKEQSYNHGANVLAPNGSTFVDAEAVMYAKANYKPRTPELTSLEKFIESDKEEFLTDFPGLHIKEDELTTGDGQKMRSFLFSPEHKGEWEQVSYGEEGQYYLIFVLSAHSKKGFDRAQYAYGELIAHYKAKL